MKLIMKIFGLFDNPDEIIEELERIIKDIKISKVMFEENPKYFVPGASFSNCGSDNIDFDIDITDKNYKDAYHVISDFVKDPDVLDMVKRWDYN